jgi:hypothetical protein
MSLFRVASPSLRVAFGHATTFNVASVPTTPISVPTSAQTGDTIIDSFDNLTGNERVRIFWRYSGSAWVQIGHTDYRPLVFADTISADLDEGALPSAPVNFNTSKTTSYVPNDILTEEYTNGYIQWTFNGTVWVLDYAREFSNPTASEIAITAITALPGDTTVQDALETLAIRPYRLMVGFGDEADVTTGNTVTLRSPDAFTITSVRASVQTASSSGLVDVDVKKNGVTIFSTRVTIDSGEKTSVTAVTPAVVSVTAVADNDELTIEVIDDGTGATGLVVSIKGTLP